MIKSIRMRWVVHVVLIAEMRNYYKIVVVSLKGREHSRDGTDGREIGLEAEDWINMAQDKDWWRALVNTVMNLRVP
jgi:hypothetical protein